MEALEEDGGIARFACSPPTLYHQPFHESPVRGVPGELLMIPGNGFSANTETVVYQHVTDTTQPLVPPASIPQITDGAAGIATVEYRDGADSLTVRLPSVMLPGQSYALWVPCGSSWGKGILINDARPLWISPAQAYESAQLGGLERELKVIGRNLQPQPGHVTRVRLTHSSKLGVQFIQDALLDAPDSPIAHYVARIALPPMMQRGNYLIHVQRDGVSWELLQQQQLDVQPNPRPTKSYNVDDDAYAAVCGMPCAPDDNGDDTCCILEAVKKAEQHGGGTVRFPPGVWDLSFSNTPGVDARYGIVLPPGVDLKGISPEQVTVRKNASWIDLPAFTVQRRNRVSGIHFEDRLPTQKNYAFFQIGKHPAEPGDNSVEDVTFTRNVFDRPNGALGSTSVRVRRLYVTHNEFGAYETAIGTYGEDTVITHNIFRPGGSIDCPGGGGTIANSLHSARRVDLSDNFVDGLDRTYLDNAPPGWRAGFFWDMGGSHEMMLTSRNKLTCTGDKAGDGEALSYDANGNQTAFTNAKPVVAATANAVTVSTADGDPLRKENYPRSFWVQVGNGPGIGQTRKVQKVAEDVAAQTVTFHIEPDWDVVPTAASRITVTKQYWQVYTVDNRVDNSSPPCTPQNRNGPRTAGTVIYHGPTADSTMEANHQYDTGGLVVSTSYVPSNHIPQFFVELRGNVVNGEVDYNSSHSTGGITLLYAAHTDDGSVSPVVSGYGISFTGNVVTHSATEGGISLLPGGETILGSRVVASTLIQRNTVGVLPPPNESPVYGCDGAPLKSGGYPQLAIGISIRDHEAQSTLLGENIYLPPMRCRCLNQSSTTQVITGSCPGVCPP